MTRTIASISSSGDAHPLIHVSSLHIALAMAPLGLLAFISWRLGLSLESPILVGVVRTFVQLSILSTILDPIFYWGVDYWLLVVGYVFVMVLLAAFESSTRSKYYFSGMFWYVLATLLANVAAVSLFAFGIVLQPDPLWDPQYVIPIVGMLLGNCINGISLSMNSMLTAMVESSREVELLLSFGANTYEASERLLRESIRTGAVPQLNSMSIIGIISIPGMMTGQILGGSSVVDAARYQILIMYLIALCAFATILTQLLFVLGIFFDSRMILRTDRLRKRDKQANALEIINGCCRFVTGCLTDSKRNVRRISTSFSFSREETRYIAPRGRLTVSNCNAESANHRNSGALGVSDLTYSFEKKQDETAVLIGEELEEDKPTRRILFQSVSFQVSKGGAALINGPSGVGKSTMLRILAGLAMPDEGTIELLGQSLNLTNDIPAWRKQVLYVPQTKVDIPGSPNDLMQKISSFSVCSRLEASSYADVRASARELVSAWGMNVALLDSEWKALSGGESQRVLLALALASKPKVILLDESTSALDQDSKIRVERSVQRYSDLYGMCAIWITHDQGQQERVQPQ